MLNNSSRDLKPFLYLAPMEGVTDFVMRDLLTKIGGIDQCTTEFVRVTTTLHPHSVFYKYCPELKTGGKTAAGVPVYVQLLGGKPEPLAINALRAAEMGAPGIDLNFGCPAKTVNRHDGGAALLKSCNRIYEIVKAVRDAVPKNIPVSAKIRLGFDDPRVCLENAKAAEDGGADLLTVHCRTKTDGYRPPAYWNWIPKIKSVVKLPVVANGEIWTMADFNRCFDVTGCDRYMIGRGALRNPYLFSEIKNVASKNSDSIKLLPGFFETCETKINGHFATGRTKQWLAQLRFVDPKAKAIFDEIKVFKKPEEFKSALLARI